MKKNFDKDSDLFPILSFCSKTFQDGKSSFSLSKTSKIFRLFISAFSWTSIIFILFDVNGGVFKEKWLLSLMTLYTKVNIWKLA